MSLFSLKVFVMIRHTPQYVFVSKSILVCEIRLLKLQDSQICKKFHGSKAAIAENVGHHLKYFLH